MASMEKTPVEYPEMIRKDTEAQSHTKYGTALAPEYGIATSTKYLCLALYFNLNLILTLYNKAVLGKVCLS